MLYLPAPSGQAKARVKFRDHDGRVRLVSKTGASRAAAERALKEALTARRTPSGTAALTSGSRMRALAEHGLVAQPRPKTAAGWQVIALPECAVRMLERRRAAADGAVGGIVFAAPLARGLRDPVNVSGHLRELLDGFDGERCAGSGYQPGPAGVRQR